LGRKLEVVMNRDGVNWEVVKTVLNAVSALVAVAGAATAVHARRVSRRDVFEERRDALMLLFAQNTERARAIAFQATLCREELESLVKEQYERLPDDVVDLVAGLRNLEAFVPLLDRRPYTPETLAKIEYSESNLSRIRGIAVAERSALETLNNSGHEVVLQTASRKIARMRRQASQLGGEAVRPASRGPAA
jgi:hypothetical protein